MPQVTRRTAVTAADIGNAAIQDQNVGLGVLDRYRTTYVTSIGSSRVGTTRYIVYRNLPGGTSYSAGSPFIDFTQLTLGTPRLWRVVAARAGSASVT